MGVHDHHKFVRSMTSLFNSLLSTLCMSNLLLILSNMVESLGALQLQVLIIIWIVTKSTLITLWMLKIDYRCPGTQPYPQSSMFPPTSSSPSQVGKLVLNKIPSNYPEQVICKKLSLTKLLTIILLTVFLTVAITVERYQATCRLPNTSKTFCLNHRI